MDDPVAGIGAVMKITGRILSFLWMMTALITGVGAGAVSAGPVPDGGRLAFKVLMDGTEIGRHVVEFDRKQDRLVVDIKINFIIKILNIPIYRYNHHNHEVWSPDGKLLALNSLTNDDGVIESAKIERQGDLLMINGTRNKEAVPGLWLTSSYWRSDIINQTHLIDSRNGQIFKINVRPVGQFDVALPDRVVKATRYDVTGDLELSVWYDESGEWVKLAFDHRGRHIDYQRIAPDAATPPNAG
jgi:hypothetical protein